MQHLLKIYHLQQLANQSAVNINHIAITELEKVKENLLENLYDLYSCPMTIWEKYGDLYPDVVVGGINKTIDQQINALKGEKDEKKIKNKR